MRTSIIICLSVCTLLFFMTSPLEAQIPRLINYQGILTDTGGSPITGSHALIFSLYSDSAASATLLWTDSYPAVSVDEGLFHVILGNGAAIPDSAFVELALWLGIQVDADPEIAPRSQITSTPWSIRAAMADSAGMVGAHSHDDLYFTESELSTPGALNDGGNPVDWTKLKGVPGGFADGTDDVGGPDGDWTINGSDMSSAVAGNVGIGTPTPSVKLEVAGMLQTDTLKIPTGAAAGLILTTDANGVASWQPAPGTGDITAVFAGTGLTGGGTGGDVTMNADLAGSGAATTVARSDHEHDAYSDTAHAHDNRYFTESELNTSGVLNDAGNPVDWTRLKGVPADFADGTDDISTDTDWTINVNEMYSGVSGNVGVGTNSPAAKLHVLNSNGNYVHLGHDTYGVFGYHQTGANFGYIGSSQYGVYGKDSNTGSYGFLGGGNTGVAGHSSTAAGISGTSTSGYGIYGFSDFSWAGFFQGDIRVVGSVTEGAAFSLIDHPLDPENMLLRNKVVVSPENLLIYRGKVTLDESGEAIVTMPGYFKALAREEEATVTLTSVGRPFLTGYEWRSDGAAFIVYGDPGRDVSWTALAGRDDPVSRQLAMPVEEEKGPDNGVCDRGEFLYPAAYGYPANRGADYQTQQELAPEK